MEGSRNNSFNSETDSARTKVSGTSQVAQLSTVSGCEFKTPSLFHEVSKSATRVKRSLSERCPKSQALNKKPSVRIMKRKNLNRGLSAEDSSSTGASPASSKPKKSNSITKVFNRIKSVRKKQSIVSSDDFSKGQKDFLDNFDKIPDASFVENWLLSIDDETAQQLEVEIVQEIGAYEAVEELGNLSLGTDKHQEKDEEIQLRSRIRLLSEDSKKSEDTQGTGEDSEITALNTQHNSNPKFTSEGDSIRRETSFFKPIEMRQQSQGSLNSLRSEYLEMHALVEEEAASDQSDDGGTDFHRLTDTSWTRASECVRMK